MTGSMIMVGTRGSLLAQRQTAEVIARLQAAFPSATFRPQEIRTTGDERLDLTLAAIGGEGVFVKEIELALERGEIAIAVHSLKDLPTQSPHGFVVAAVLPRADARDALVMAHPGTLHDLPDGAVIGTGSSRRRSQLAMINPRWRFVEVRGNLDTRLAKLDVGKCAALILAAAGLDRLGRSERIAQRLPYSLLLPAPGQGAIAIQIRQSDELMAKMVRVLDDPLTHAAVTAERALLSKLGGGCQVPLGAHAEVEGGYLVLEGLLASTDGQVVLRSRLEGPLAKPVELGETLAEELLAKGGKDLLCNH